MTVTRAPSPSGWSPPWARVAAVVLPVGVALWVDEEAPRDTARARRKEEFCGGRTAAREALADLGHPPSAILVGRHRVPCWPAGIRGSITHDGRIAAAIVAPADRCAAIGIDVLADEAVDEELFEMVLTPGERAIVSTRPKIERRLFATLAFASKEATFKAQFPLSGRWLDFQDVEVDLPQQLERGRITIRARVFPPRDQAVAPLDLCVTVVQHAGSWWAATWLT